MDRPVPEVTGADVDRIIRRDFPPGDRPLVAEGVLRVPGHRNQLAVLKLMAGRLDLLSFYVDMAESDSRDIVAQAEYPHYFKLKPEAFEALPATDRKQIVEADWSEYHAWINAS